MRWLRVSGSSHTEPADRDDLAARLRINNAVAITKALSRVATQLLDEALLRTMLVDVHTYATFVVVIANPDIQQRGYD